jgi:lactate dehydrogenase-like 2-hydroxyacid dehydrogenase
LLDAVILEKAGIPSLAIVTDAFDSTAKEMAELWGVPNFRFVMMPHPLASLTSAQIERHAQDLIDKILALLQQGQPD